MDDPDIAAGQTPHVASQSLRLRSHNYTSVRDKRRRAISNYRPITRSAEIKQLIVQVISRRGLAVRDAQYIDFKILRIYKSIKGSQQNRAPVYFLV